MELLSDYENSWSDDDDDDDGSRRRSTRSRCLSTGSTTATTAHKRKTVSGANAIVVLDLDDTLIDSKCRPFPHLSGFLNKLLRAYTVVLWTAGNRAHAEKFIESTPAADKFHTVITGLLSDNSKRAERVDRIFSQKNIIPYVLIDDRSDYFKTGNYDINVNVTNYYTRGKVFYIDYDRLLYDLHERVRAWSPSTSKSRKDRVWSTTVTTRNRKRPPATRRKRPKRYPKLIDLNSDDETNHDNDDDNT